jgi:hypothetical protein
MKFRANKGGTIAVSVTTTTQSVALPPGGGGLLRLLNVGAGIAFAEVGPSGANAAVPSASGGGMAVGANLPAEYVQLKQGDANIALIGSANCTVYVSRGDLV